MNLVLGVLAVGALALTGCSSWTGQPSSTQRPLLIKHGWDVPPAWFVKSHVADLEKLPFDGLTVAMPSLNSKIQSQTPVAYETIATELAPMAQTKFTTLRHNFLMVYSAPAGDLFGDWTVPVSNFANLARAARDAGFEGVFYDNEEYFGAAVQYPDNCAGRTLADCQQQAQLRGRQVMDAMRGAWPEVRVLTFHGAWISDPETVRNLPGVTYYDGSKAYPLWGSFVIGMVAGAAGTSAKIIDGGEIYTPRTSTQFETVKAWQKQGIAAKSALIPSSLKPQWAETVSAAFGVYDKPWSGASMDAATWTTTLANALASTDQYVWAYTERYDWTGIGQPTTRVTTEWIDATRAARSPDG